MQNMIEKLKELEKQVLILEPEQPEREAILKAMSDYANNYLEELKTAPSSIYVDSKNIPNIDYSFSSPTTFSEIIKFIDENVDKKGLNTTAGTYLAYVPGGGLFHSAVGDFIADISNRYTGLYFPNPYAVEIENSLIRWMLNIVGFDQNKSWGNLTSGGSIANLIAVVTARDAKLQQSDFAKAVVYTTAQAHHCVHKALRIAGFNANEPGTEGNIHYIDVDECYRLDVNALQTAIAEDRKNGKIPWLLVASAGATNLGSVDPLEKLSEIAEKEKLWFHVDGAYGGFFVLADSAKHKLKGIEKADSVVMDAHKGLFLPYGLGSVLIKDRELTFKSFHYASVYIEEDDFTEKYSPANMSPELTKPFRGLRLWLPLKLFGAKVFKKSLDEKILLAEYLYEKLLQVPDIEIINKPELSIFGFCFKPKSDCDQKLRNQYTRELINMINATGKTCLSATTIQKKSSQGIMEDIYVIRLAILSFRTHLQHIDDAFEAIRLNSKLLNERSL